MSLGMKVQFEDTTRNWQLWGQLVKQWVSGLKTLPKEIPALIEQATKQGITKVVVPGPQDRNVVFHWYDEAKTLAFLLPSEDMLKSTRAQIEPGPYPLPVFYDEAFNGPRRDLTEEQDTLFANRRVGEYTINNCC